MGENKNHQSKFLKARKKFNDFFYNLDEKMKSFTDDEAASYLKVCKKIRKISQLAYLFYFILIKSGVLKSVSPIFFITFFIIFSFIFTLLYALLYGLEVANSGSAFLIYKKNKDSKLTDLSLKMITREKFINVFMVIIIILMY